jgi:hypothetical protein
MNTHEIVNLIVVKFGGNRVKFDGIGDSVVWFVLGRNEYRCHASVINNCLFVKRCVEDTWQSDNYSQWVEGILNGMVRNEAGEMVTR